DGERSALSKPVDDVELVEPVFGSKHCVQRGEPLSVPNPRDRPDQWEECPLAYGFETPGDCPGSPHGGCIAAEPAPTPFVGSNSQVSDCERAFLDGVRLHGERRSVQQKWRLSTGPRD